MIGGIVAQSTVNVHTEPETTVIELRGDVDVGCVACLCQVLVDALFHQPTHRLVVDLVRTTTIDAAGVGALVAAGYTAEEMHVPFALRCPDPLIAAEFSDLVGFAAQGV